MLRIGKNMCSTFIFKIFNAEDPFRIHTLTDIYTHMHMQTRTHTHTTHTRKHRKDVAGLNSLQRLLPSQTRLRESVMEVRACKDLLFPAWE